MAEKVDPFVELGNRGLYQPYGYDRLEFLPQLRGQQASEIYREMESNDALIGAILFQITMLLRRVNWEVEPAEGPRGEERADFLQTCLDDMSTTWEEVIHDALTMLPFGFAYMEIVYKRRDSTDLEAPAEGRTRFPDGRIGWRKMVLLPQETVAEFQLDEYGGVQAAVQRASYGEAAVIPIDKALLFRTRKRGPRGVSVLRNVAESWYYRKRIREIEGIGIERDLAGLPVFTLDADIMANTSRLAEYQAIVRNLRRDDQEGVLLPGIVNDQGELLPLAKLELLSTAGSRQFDTNAIVNRYSREIAMALLQDVILLGHEKVGTQALASEKRDLSDTALQAWLNDIAATFNAHAVPRLFALNGEPLEDLPVLVPGELRPTDVQGFATAVKDIAAAGFALADDPEIDAEVRRRLGFPPLLPEVAALMAEAQLEPPAPPPSFVPAQNGQPTEEPVPQ